MYTHGERHTYADGHVTVCVRPVAQRHVNLRAH